MTNESFMDAFYNNPKEISQVEFDKIDKLLVKYNLEIIENKYSLYVTNSSHVKKLFILFLFYFDFSIMDKTKKIHCGIDFEFNRNVIALMQLNFGKHLWIIDPRQYGHRHLQIILEKLLLNNKIYKVLHGSESLDVPYIYFNLLEGDKNKIIKFTNRLIDTRFLCEYVRQSKEEKGRCSIYDGMLYFKTVDENKYAELYKINKSMGPIQNVKWDVNKLNNFTTKYAYYDVIYLNNFLMDIYKVVINHTPTLTKTYYYIISIIRLVFLMRQNVTNIMDIFKGSIQILNMKTVKINGVDVVLSTLYEKFIKNYSINSINFDLIRSNDYIRGPINLIFKYVFYLVILKKYEISLVDQHDNLVSLFSELLRLKMKRIVKLLKLYKNDILDKIQ